MTEENRKLRSIFEKCVKENFDFLRSHGVRLEQKGSDEFSFEINNVLIKILLTKGHVLDINILLRPLNREDDYGIRAVCEALQIDNNLRNGFETPVQLVQLVGDYIDVFKDKVMELIIGNKIDWNMVDAYISKKIFSNKIQANKKTTSRRGDKIKNDAEIAFKNKDFDRVVKLLNNIRDILTVSERKKFEYSLKQISKKTHN